MRLEVWEKKKFVSLSSNELYKKTGSYLPWKLRAFLNKIAPSQSGKYTPFHCLNSPGPLVIWIGNLVWACLSTTLSQWEPTCRMEEKLHDKGTTKHLQILQYSCIHQLRHWETYLLWHQGLQVRCLSTIHSIQRKPSILKWDLQLKCCLQGNVEKRNPEEESVFYVACDWETNTLHSGSQQCLQSEFKPQNLQCTVTLTDPCSSFNSSSPKTSLVLFTQLQQRCRRTSLSMPLSSRRFSYTSPQTP